MKPLNHQLELPHFDDFMGGSSPASRRVAIAIPVKNESERLAKCLTALAAQTDDRGRRMDPETYRVFIFANNCTDDSASLARSVAERLGLPLTVTEAWLPPAEAHAGNARGSAMALAETWLARNNEAGGVILTTDADSQVPSLWIANNLAAIEAGADAVLGRIELDEEGAFLPPALHRRGQLEGEYEALLTQLSAILDPVDFNPWPHHATISGATLAVTRQAYLRAGGLPRVPLGEDKALVTELFRRDARIRFSPDILVTTSGRLFGRAPGGVADTLRLRCAEARATCDESLEPFRVAIRRAKWRGRVRHLHRLGLVSRNIDWADALEIPVRQARRLGKTAAFGAIWSGIEAASPLLARGTLTPAELPGQISGARRALRRLGKNGLSSPQYVEPELRVAVVAVDDQGRTHARDEEVGSLVSG